MNFTFSSNENSLAAHIVKVAVNFVFYYEPRQIVITGFQQKPHIFFSQKLWLRNPRLLQFNQVSK